jgi:hypothetical protein
VCLAPKSGIGEQNDSREDRFSERLARLGAKYENLFGRFSRMPESHPEYENLFFFLYYHFFKDLSRSLSPEGRVRYIYSFPGPDLFPGMFAKMFAVNIDSREFSYGIEFIRRVLGNVQTADSLVRTVIRNTDYVASRDATRVSGYGELDGSSDTAGSQNVMILKGAYRWERLRREKEEEETRPGSRIALGNVFWPGSGFSADDSTASSPLSAGFEPDFQQLESALSHVFMRVMKTGDKIVILNREDLAVIPLAERAGFRLVGERTRFYSYDREAYRSLAYVHASRDPAKIIFLPDTFAVMEKRTPRYESVGNRAVLRPLERAS